MCKIRNRYLNGNELSTRTERIFLDHSLPLYEDSTFSNLSYADGEKERKKRVPESVKNLARSPRPLISEISRRNAICNAIRNLWVII